MLKKIAKKSSLLVVLVTAIFALFIFTKADNWYTLTVNNAGNDNNTVNVEEAHPVNLIDPDDGQLKPNMIGRVVLNSDAGYYAKDLTISYQGQELDLGFEAGTENGSFFRKYIFNPHENAYQFLIPTGATDPVDINVTFAKKDPINITYMKYTGNNYDEDSITNLNNYDQNEVALIDEYLEGDIILPNDCTDNGCMLKIDFDNDAAFNNYKSTHADSTDQNKPWLFAEAGYEAEDGYKDVLLTSPDGCNEEEHYCLVLVTNDFKEVGQGLLNIGYTRAKLFSDGYTGFNVRLDVQNFEDVLREKGRESISFSESKNTIDLDIFYGTRVISLIPISAEAILQDCEGLSQEACNALNKPEGTLGNTTAANGSGYGYNVSYVAGKVLITIDRFYQNELNIDFNLTQGDRNINATLELHRFAFAGNAGELLVVDAQGKNCSENNNANKCNEGTYYSTQYRGIAGFMYIDQATSKTTVDNVVKVESISGNDITLSGDHSIFGYARDKSFVPHAIALFYDVNDMIVKTKIIDLNTETLKEGLVKKDVFNNIYNGYNYTLPNTTEYVGFGDGYLTTIDKLEYFYDNLEDAFDHNLILIGVDEAKELGVKKIALFLVNGEIEQGNIPELTYGIGEGRVMEIRDENRGGE